MSLKRKLILLIIGCIFILLTVTTSILEFEKLQNDKITKSVKESMKVNTDQKVSGDIAELLNDISNYISTLEAETEKNMMNAAYVLKEMDEGKNLNNEDLDAIRKQTGMTDISLVDSNGTITNDTEKASIGFNLFVLGDSYKMLVDGKLDRIATPLKARAETGEIFKFMGVPRGKGKGIAQVGLNTSHFEKSINNFLKDQYGVKAIYIFDNENTVLTENLKNGYPSVWKKGQKATDEKITNIFKDSKPNLSLKDKKIEIYYPILVEGKTKYAIYAFVDVVAYYSNNEIAQKGLDEVSRALEKNIYFIVVGNLILSVIAIVLVLFVIKKDLKPLENMVDRSIQIAEGNLSEKNTIEAKGSTEINKLANAFNKMTSNLRNMIVKFSTSSQYLAASAEELLANAEESKGATQNVTNIIQEVSEHIFKQAKEIKESVEDMVKMAGNIEKISGKATAVSSSADETKGLVSKGNVFIQNTIFQMNTLSKTVSHSAGIVKVLGDRSNEIENIVSTITNIATQTNLLALNAAIEAARAGESGKGFAVVADEVRKLAEQSSEATKQISTVIASIQKDTSQAVQAMEMGTTEVVTGIESINEVGSLFEEIQTSIDVVAVHIKEVSQTLSNTNETIAKTVNIFNGISVATEEISIKAENIAANAIEQNASIEEVSLAANALTEMADELGRTLVDFKLE